MGPEFVWPRAIVLQNTDAIEVRRVSKAAMLLDIPVTRVSIGDLGAHAVALGVGALPVGSVEFIRQAMCLAEIDDPEPMTYPIELDHLLRRRLDITTIERVRGTKFVKPVRTKLFTGFVWDSNADDGSYNEHDLEQLNALRTLAPTTQIWATDPVQWLCEWRYYICHGKIIGAERYDPDGADEAPAPEGRVLQEAIQRLAESSARPAAYGLDLGVLSTGETALVEVNDAWSLGMYGGSIDSKDYLRLLATRWAQILDTRPKVESRMRSGPSERCGPLATPKEMDTSRS
jgi:hypothetical protein